MRFRRFLTGLAVWLLVAFSSGAAAQEGYPLDGTWRGNWGTEPGPSNLVVIVMKWDGETINGRINPGPNAIDFASAALDPSNWTVHIEAEPADGERIVIEGTLRDIGSYNRRIEGTWTRGGQTHPFRIARE